MTDLLNAIRLNVTVFILKVRQTEKNKDCPIFFSAQVPNIYHCYIGVVRFQLLTW